MAQILLLPSNVIELILHWCSSGALPCEANQRLLKLLRAELSRTEREAHVDSDNSPTADPELDEVIALRDQLRSAHQQDVRDAINRLPQISTRNPPLPRSCIARCWLNRH